MPPVRRKPAMIEAFESRTLFNANYVVLSAGALNQNWANTGLITTTDDWSAVAGINGFKGDGLTSLTGKDPQTIIAGTNTTLMVLANQTNTSLSTGGVAEFNIADPTVAIKGSGSANAPYLQFYLDATGMKAVQVSYKLRDLDAGANNSIQPVALQYRLADSGNWINVPAAFVADASDGPNLTKTTNVSVTLPGAVNNQSVVQVRVITSDAVGTDEYIGVDDISISATPIPQLLLNEVDVNPPGPADSPYEYVEVKGTPGQTLNDVYVLAIDGDSFDAGVVVASLALNNVAFGSNGLILIKGSTGGFASEDANTTIVTDSSLTANGPLGALVDGAISFVVVYSPSNIDDYTLLDQDQNGTLEGLPEGTQILDTISWKLPTATSDIIYGTQLPTTGSLIPDAATRISGNTTPNSASAWYYGDLNDTGLGNQTKAYYAPTAVNLPSTSAVITPGKSNFAAPGAPGVESTSFNPDNRPMQVQVDFSKDVSASLVLADDATASFILTNRNTSTNVPAASITKSYNFSNDVVTLRFPGATNGTVTGMLPDGNYRLTVVAANVKDSGNTPMAANVTYDFYVLNGDATQDRKVDTKDFNLLANWFGSGAQVFSHGDFNYDTVVDSNDFNIFAGQYGKSIAALPGSVAAGPALFGTLSLDGSDSAAVLG